MFKTLIKARDLLTFDSKKLLIFDCSYDIKDADQCQRLYEKRHLKGAFYAHLDKDLSTKPSTDSGNHPLPDIKDFVSFLNSHGMSSYKQVVVYDNIGGGFAARMWWMLKWVGHEKVAVLEGTAEDWQAAGLLFDAEKPLKTQGDYKLKTPLVAEVLLHDVEKNLTNQKFLLIDSRQEERFKGRKEPLYKVKGHIPYAKNRFFLDNLEESGKLKSKKTLKDEFAPYVKTKEPQDIVFYCGSGVTACFNIMAMEHAGYKGARLYVGSWSQWIKDNKRLVVKSS